MRNMSSTIYLLIQPQYTYKAISEFLTHNPARDNFTN